MDGNLSLILAFLVSISVVLALVIKFKLHPFLSLFIGCLLILASFLIVPISLKNDA